MGTNPRRARPHLALNLISRHNCCVIGGSSRTTTGGVISANRARNVAIVHGVLARSIVGSISPLTVAGPRRKIGIFTVAPFGMTHACSSMPSIVAISAANSGVPPAYGVPMGKSQIRPLAFVHATLSRVYCGPPSLMSSPPARWKSLHLNVRRYDLWTRTSAPQSIRRGRIGLQRV